MDQEDVFAPGDALRNAEILYVDGDSHRRDALRRLAAQPRGGSRAGRQIGKEALKVVLGTPCNLIIAEHRLIATSGIQLVRDIRAVVNYPRALVPVLVVSDPVSADIIAAAFEAGANHFLIRPLTAAKLYERLAWALADARPFFVKDGHYVMKMMVKPKLPAPGTLRMAATK